MKKLTHLVAWLEILSGVLMIVTLATRLISANDPVALLDLNTGGLVGLGAPGLVCGLGLLRSRTWAWHGSLALQLLLTPVFWMGSAIYRPGLGLFIPLGINLETAGKAAAINEFSFGVDFAMTISASGGQQYIAANVAALICVVILMIDRPANSPTRGFPART